MAGVMITGAAGLVGSHLLERLRDDGAGELLGAYSRPTIRLDDIAGRFEMFELDMRYAEPVRRVIAARRPAAIYHLAAQSLPVVSWANPWETLEVNVLGTVNLFEAIRSVRATDAGYDPVVVVACSSAEYGASLTPERLPVDEDAPLLPLHPYGVSKVAQDLLAFQYFRNDGIRCIRARIFNCTGPRKRNDVVSDLASRVAGMLRARQASGRLRIGNQASRRAIIDVRDLCDALIRLAAHGAPGEAYNICAEQLTRIGDLVPLFAAISGLELAAQTDPALLRPSDEAAICGRTDKLRAATGWTQRIALETTLRDVLDYERRSA